LLFNRNSQALPWVNIVTCIHESNEFGIDLPFTRTTWEYGRKKGKADE